MAWQFGQLLNVHTRPYNKRPYWHAIQVKLKIEKDDHMCSKQNYTT